MSGHIYDGVDPLASPAPIAGKGEFPDVPVPDDDIDITAASLGAGLEALTDRDNWLRHHGINDHDGGVHVFLEPVTLEGEVTITTTGIIHTDELEAENIHADTVSANSYEFTSAPTFDRSVEAHGYPDAATTAFWDFASYFWTINSAAAGHLMIPLHLPHGCVLNSVTVHINPPGGHAAFPGGAPTMPTIAVRRRTIATGSEATLQGATDGSATAGAYEAIHSITATLASPHTVNRETNVYFVSLFTEAAPNAIAGTIVLGASVNYTVSDAVTE